MTLTKLFAGAAGLAMMAAATPAAAQYAYGYNQYSYPAPVQNPYSYPAQTPYAYPNQGYANQYGYANPYGNAYGYNNANATQLATQQCSAAVQSRLGNRTTLAGILGAVLGNRVSQGRVVSITQVNPRRNTIRVKGLASSGASNGYGAYGAGAYGALGYAYQPDLSFSCSVDYQGRVRDVNLTRR